MPITVLPNEYSKNRSIDRDAGMIQLSQNSIWPFLGIDCLRNREFAKEANNPTESRYLSLTLVRPVGETACKDERL
jgi:hypothetical protein